VVDFIFVKQSPPGFKFLFCVYVLKVYEPSTTSLQALQLYKRYKALRYGMCGMQTWSIAKTLVE